MHRNFYGFQSKFTSPPNSAACTSLTRGQYLSTVPFLMYHVRTKKCTGLECARGSYFGPSFKIQLFLPRITPEVTHA